LRPILRCRQYPKELITTPRQPGKLTFGAGSSPPYVGRAFENHDGIDMLYVPYKSNSQVTNHSAADLDFLRDARLRCRRPRGKLDFGPGPAFTACARPSDHR
jgi:hypothetical protein